MGYYISFESQIKGTISVSGMCVQNTHHDVLIIIWKTETIIYGHD